MRKRKNIKAIAKHFALYANAITCVASLNVVWISELKKQEKENTKVNAATAIQKGKHNYLSTVYRFKQYTDPHSVPFRKLHVFVRKQ